MNYHFDTLLNLNEFLENKFDHLSLLIRSQLLQLLQIRAGREVMAMKMYSILPRFSKLEPYHQMQFSVISRTPLFGTLLPLCKRYRQCILSSTNGDIQVEKDLSWNYNCIAWTFFLEKLWIKSSKLSQSKQLLGYCWTEFFFFYSLTSIKFFLYPNLKPSITEIFPIRFSDLLCVWVLVACALWASVFYWKI